MIRSGSWIANDDPSSLLALASRQHDRLGDPYPGLHLDRRPLWRVAGFGELAWYQHLQGEAARHRPADQTLRSVVASASNGIPGHVTHSSVNRPDRARWNRICP